VESGKLSVIVRGKTVCSLGPGDFFGEVALLKNGGVRKATVVAAAPCKLMCLGRRDFAAINRLQPDFISQMMKQKKNTYSESLETEFGVEATKFMNRVPCLAELGARRR
jgi:CRP-like cAMP-binding protein